MNELINVGVLKWGAGIVRRGLEVEKLRNGKTVI